MSATFKINEIFYSLQGEGHFTGTPSVFIRFSGCNLACPFCDTLHQNGTQMSLSDIIATTLQHPARHVVLTGGEPSLFITQELIDTLHAHNRFVCIETNGTHHLPNGIDWVTLSPKTFISTADNHPIVLTRCDELKVVFTTEEQFQTYPHIRATHRYLQPCDVGNSDRNAEIQRAVIAYCLAHPQWSLSLQTHKLLHIR